MPLREPLQDLPRSSRRKGSRSSTTELPVIGPSPFLCKPAPPTNSQSFSSNRSASSPLLSSVGTSFTPVPASDSEEEPIYTSLGSVKGGQSKTATWSHSQSSTSLRSRLFGNAPLKKAPRAITTAPGESCAGETETEIDEPPTHLPTSRILPTSAPLVPPNALQRLTPILFEFSRLLSIVPAVFGALYNLYHAFNPPDPFIRIDGHLPPERVDYFVSVLWAILTGYQCISLASGLLTRWRVYYPPLATLIRLLALQAICWPATHMTLTILEHQKRPVMVWAVVATTTCMSRSIQLWVTSNLWWETRGAHGDEPPQSRGYWKRFKGGQWGGRRWDWGEVGLKCMFPCGIVYFVAFWVDAVRREVTGC